MALFGLVLLLAAPVAAVGQEPGAQQRADELGLSVAVGLDGRSREGSWQPVAVGLEPARPVAGTLSVTVASTSTEETVPVEVAAGSRKVYRFVVPAGPLEVTFAEGGADPLTVRPANAPVTGDYLVGMLGGVGDNLPPLRSETTGRSGAWVSLDPAWLDLSAHTLEVLGTVVANASDLQALPPHAASNLASAVAAGVDLVVVGSGDGGLDRLGLPFQAPADSWQVTAAELGEDAAAAGGGPPLATAFTAGAGRIVTTDVAPGAPGAGRSAAFWSLVAQPPARQPTLSSDFRVTSLPYQFARLLTESGDAPDLPGLGAFVVVYVLVVGPVNAVVLARMGRRELSWATVPMVTAVFTVGAFLGATTARPESGGTATLTYWTDGPATQLVAAGVRAPTPGVRELTLPGTHWTVRPLVDGQGIATIRRGENVSVSMPLTALQVGGVAAWKTIDAPPPLEVVATAGRDGVEITVRNTSGGPVTDVEVSAASSSRQMGTLAANETKTLTVATRLPTGAAHRDPFQGLPVNENGFVEAPLSLRGVLNAEVAQDRPGMAWASGVHEGRPVGATSAGQALRDRGSMVAVGVAVTADPTLSPFAIARDAFSAANSTYAVGPTAVEGDGEVFLRYRLPAGADPQQLSNQLERSGQSDGRTQLTVWDVPRGQWVSLDEGFGGDPRRLVGPLGDVWVRASGSMFPFEYAGRTIAQTKP